jgi:DNA-binding SARP family transcriptional activator
LLSNTQLQVAHLKIQAFGKALVWVDGKLVTTSKWKTASVRSLFFFFLTASRPATKEEIGEALWPELNTPQLNLRFKNELYRLRHALGHDVIRFDNDLYSFNRLLDYDYDVENFTIALAKTNSADSDKEKMLHLREATMLRAGPYLQDIDATWVLPEREFLDNACMNAWLELAEYYHQDGELKAALKACQDALKIDSSREDIHCLAMQLHAEKGDRLGIIWQYQACREALRSELDVDPSKKTDALFRRLTV